MPRSAQVDLPPRFQSLLDEYKTYRIQQRGIKEATANLVIKCIRDKLAKPLIQMYVHVPENGAGYVLVDEIDRTETEHGSIGPNTRDFFEWLYTQRNFERRRGTLQGNQAGPAPNAAELTRLTEQNAALVRTDSEQKMTISVLEDEKRTLTDKIASVQASFNTMGEQNKTLIAENEKLKQEATSAQATLKTLGEQNKSLLAENETLKQEATSAQATLKTLGEQKGSLLAENGELKQVVERIAKEKQALEEVANTNAASKEEDRPRKAQKKEYQPAQNSEPQPCAHATDDGRGAASLLGEFIRAVAPDINVITRSVKRLLGETGRSRDESEGDDDQEDRKDDDEEQVRPAAKRHRLNDDA